MKKYFVLLVVCMTFFPSTRAFSACGKLSDKLAVSVKPEKCPLVYAASVNDIDTVKKLIAEGADPAEECGGYYALSNAAYYGHPKMIKLLVKSGVDVNQKNGAEVTPLITAVRAGETACAEQLLALGADIETKDYEGNTPLILASRYGSAETAKLLLKRGANVNAAERHGFTPLMAASEYEEDSYKKRSSEDKGTIYKSLCPIEYNGQIEIVKLLLKKGADVEAKDKYGATALNFAASGGHTQIAEALIASGADVNYTDETGYTPLHSAALLGETEVIKILLKRGANLNAKTKSGWTALMFASHKGHIGAVKFLLSVGADKRIKNEEGKTAYQLASNEKTKALFTQNNKSKDKKSL